MKDSIKILFVEDVLSDAELNWRELEKGGIVFKKLLVDNRNDFLEGLESFKPDIIISDYSLSQFDGMQALLLRNELVPQTPFIVVTGSVNEEVAVECMKAGADDYVIKEHLIRLPFAVKEALKKSLEKSLEKKEKKATEDALRKERKLLRTLIDNLPDPIYVMDKDCRKIIANNADISNIGLENEMEVLGKTDIELFKGDIGQRGHFYNKEVIGSGKALINFEEEFVDSKGVRRWLLTTKIPLHDTDGTIIGLVGIGHDITERKKAEEGLMHSFLFNESLLKTIPFGMHIVDETGTVLFQNDYLKRLFGEEAIGSKCWELYRDDKKQCSDCPLIRGIIIGETEAYESYGVLGDRIFEISHTGMIYNGKKAMLEIFLDITERKEDELELIEAKEKAVENNKLKTAFLHNISHEIRTPMNAIVGFSALLGESETDEKIRKAYIEQIMQSSDHLLAIISDIVDISNIEANIVKLAKDVTDVNARVNSLCDQYIQKVDEKKIELIYESGVAGNDAIIITDSVKLIQILTNLINNAIKFTSNGYIKVGCELKGKYLEFRVVDTGIGISAEHHQKIFDRFYQVENSVSRLYEGTGLGLAISKAYVELLGGKIWLTSEPGKGTTFYFTVPFEKQVAGTREADKKRVVEGFAFQEKKTILVAEDINSNFRLISYFLTGANIDIIRAVNGKEAVEKFLSNSNIDLILMDIRMPVMDGYTAVKLIREKNSTIPIIAQTAYANDESRAIEAGCSAFIAKPFDKKKLINSILEVIKTK